MTCIKHNISQARAPLCTNLLDSRQGVILKDMDVKNV